MKKTLVESDNLELVFGRDKIQQDYLINFISTDCFIAFEKLLPNKCPGTIDLGGHMSGWIHVRVDRMDSCPGGHMSGWTQVRVDTCLGRLDGLMSRGTHVRVDKYLGGQISGWTHVRVETCLGRHMSRWTHV